MNKKVITELQKLANPERAEVSQRFFKTGKGEYGEGDVFIGVSVPDQRKVAKQFSYLSLGEVEQLLQSKVHEERLTALIILCNQYKKASDDIKKQIYNFYLKNTAYINNWDLVDTSAPIIVGEYLWRNYAQNETPAKNALSVLAPLAKSENIWQRRIAILATFYFIDKGDIIETFTVSEVLLNDPHDLIQKAVGWMLREVGKRVSLEEEERFLQENDRYKTMPRTMLRYAIERFPEKKRQAYLIGNA